MGEASVIMMYLALIITPYDNHYVPYVGLVFNLLPGVVGTVCKSMLTKASEK